MTTTTRSSQSHRRLDVANLIVLVISLLAALFAYALIAYADVNALVIVPSIVVATLSSTHLVKYEAPRG
ncbi:hypothetical protein DVB88_04830 [Tsukamurella pulmonis]|nr:hypothetical protein DVB88_04830 [Tsukamurella pulmonis]